MDATACASPNECDKRSPGHRTVHASRIASSSSQLSGRPGRSTPRRGEGRSDRSDLCIVPTRDASRPPSDHGSRRATTDIPLCMCNVSATILRQHKNRTAPRRHDHEAPGTIRLHEGQAAGARNHCTRQQDTHVPGDTRQDTSHDSCATARTQEVKTETHPETKVTLITSR